MYSTTRGGCATLVHCLTNLSWIAPMTTIDHDLPHAQVSESAIEHRLPLSSHFISNDSSQSIGDYGSIVSRRKSRSSRDTGSSFHAEIERGFEKLQTQLQQEKRRAEMAEKHAQDAERRLHELTAHLKVINDARLVALREAGRANEELKLVLPHFTKP